MAMRKRGRIVGIDLCWLILLGLGMAVARFDAAANAEIPPALVRIQANSNQIAGGTMAGRVLTIVLEIREGEWFPEDKHGPSIKVFALAEKGKPAQIPGPMIRVPQGTSIHVIVHNLIPRDVSIHGMHTR